jgi:hypothetical protein
MQRDKGLRAKGAGAVKRSHCFGVPKHIMGSGWTAPHSTDR